MVEFALLATVLVALVIAVVWKLRPREVKSESPGVGAIRPPGTLPADSELESAPSLLEMAKREHSSEFRASLAGLVSPDRWQDSRSSSLDELRRIVEAWGDPAGKPYEATPREAEPCAPAAASEFEGNVAGRIGTDSTVSGDFVSSVARAVGLPLVEVRIRNRSEVTVLMRRAGNGSKPTAVVR
jgi:hypothetical protein